MFYSSVSRALLAGGWGDPSSLSGSVDANVFRTLAQPRRSGAGLLGGEFTATGPSPQAWGVKAHFQTSLAQYSRAFSFPYKYLKGSQALLGGGGCGSDGVMLRKLFPFITPRLFLLILARPAFIPLSLICVRGGCSLHLWEVNPGRSEAISSVNLSHISPHHVWASYSPSLLFPSGRVLSQV